MYMIKLQAENDRNGNNRALYVLIHAHGAFIQAWDEGCSGYYAVPEEYREMARCAAYVETTPKYYNEIKRNFVKK